MACTTCVAEDCSSCRAAGKGPVLGHLLHQGCNGRHVAGLTLSPQRLDHIHNFFGSRRAHWEHSSELPDTADSAAWCCVDAAWAYLSGLLCKHAGRPTHRAWLRSVTCSGSKVLGWLPQFIASDTITRLANHAHNNTIVEAAEPPTAAAPPAQRSVRQPAPCTPVWWSCSRSSAPTTAR